MFEKRVLNIYSIIIGVFFVISGIGKAIDTTAFSLLISQYGFGYLMLLSPVIVIIEILLGLLLTLLINPKRNSFYAFVLLIIFTLSFAYGHFKHGVNDCGCLGTIYPTKVPPIFTFLRNIILLLMTLIVWIKYPKKEKETSKWKKYIIGLVICPALFISGFTFSTPSFLNNNSKTHKFQNKKIINTELSKYIKTSPDSTYMIFCFSYTCPHCWNSIANLQCYKKSNTVDRVIVLATGELKDKQIFEKEFQPDFKIKDLSTKDMDKLTTAYPTAFFIQRDTIKVIIQAEIPSPYTFKKTNQLSILK